tara:strand:+ start:6050 stop:6799 length:750 start_codon:yes stop_codon:yes gene_type:complete
VTVPLIPRKGNSVGVALGRIEAVRNAIKTDPHIGGLPVGVDSMVMVPTRNIPVVNDLVDDARAELTDIYNDIRDEWPSIIGQAQTALGDLASENGLVWPTADQYLQKCKFSLTWLETQPLQFDALSDLGEEVAKRTVLESQKGHADLMRQGTLRLLSGLVDYLDESSEQWADPSRLRRERFDKIRDMVAQIQSTNWTHMTEIDDLCQSLSDLPTGDHAVAGDDRTRESAIRDTLKARDAINSTLSDLGI